MNLTKEKDHWNALVHEIGHTLVAQKLGHRASWQVYPSRTLGSKTWEGATGLPTNVAYEDRRIIGLAGAVSETLVGIIPFSFEPSDMEVVGMLHEYTFSNTDADYMDGGYTREQALRCISIVRELMPQIVELAIENGGMIPANRLRNGVEAQGSL